MCGELGWEYSEIQKKKSLLLSLCGFFWIAKSHSAFPGLKPLGSYVKHKQGLCSAAFENDVNV